MRFSMLQWVRAWTVTGLLVAMSAGAGDTASAAPIPATVHVASQAVAAKAPIARPTLKASASRVNEGDRLTLSASIKSPARAARVTLQKIELNVIYGTPEWEPVKAFRVGGRSRVA